MTAWCNRYLVAAGALGLLLLALLHPAERVAGVQEAEPKQLRLLITTGSEPPNDRLLPKVVLRPNPEPQAVYLHLFNAGPGDRANLKVRVATVGADGKITKVLLSGSVAKLGKGDVARVKLDAPAPPPPPKDAKEMPPPWPNLGVPPFQLAVVVDDGKTAIPFRVPVLLQDPTQYAEPTKVEVTNVDGNRQLVVRVGLKDRKRPLVGPNVPVALDLQPALLPGLVLQKSGTFQAELTAKRPEVELHADHVEFRGDTLPEAGRIFVSVDGYARAFLFSGTFAAGVPDRLGTALPRVRIVMPRYHLPAAVLKVPLQVDADLGRDLRVEVAFDYAGTEEYTPNPPLPSFREQVVQVGAGGDGQLLFRARVEDWVAPVKMANVFGRRKVRVRLLDAQGKVVELANEKDLQEGVPLFSREPSNRHAPLSFDANANALFAEVVIDGTPPRVVLTSLPARVTPGSQVLALAEVRRSAEQAPLERIDFYLGAPVKDDQPLPKNAVPGRWDPTRKLWVAEKSFIVPPAEKERIVVNARAVTVLKLQDSTAVTIPVVPEQLPVPVKTLKGAPIIAGVVTRGGRPQPKAKVMLLDAKGGVKATTEPNAEGKFEFKDVKPGTYTIYAAQPALKLAGAVTLTVPEDKNAKVPSADVSLVAQSK